MHAIAQFSYISLSPTLWLFVARVSWYVWKIKRPTLSTMRGASVLEFVWFASCNYI
jgi:hypothetical protein